MRGHVTGQIHGGPPELPKDGSKYNSLSHSLDLAKLNPNCHMNYSNFFVTETESSLCIVLVNQQVNQQ